MLLIYHHICPTVLIPINKEEFINNGWKFTVTPDVFEYQIQYFLGKGYKFISMDEYYKNLKCNLKEKAKDIVMTIDDGWLDNYQHAFPILKKYNIPAIFFITTKELIDFDPHKMSKEQILEIRDRGMTIGSHSCSHRQLPSIKYKDAEDEISKSKIALEGFLKGPVDYFAYPGGQLNNAIVKLVEQAGYKAACSTLSPKNNTYDDRFWLFRNPFSDSMNKIGDYYRLNTLFVDALDFRTKIKLKKLLGQ